MLNAKLVIVGAKTKATEVDLRLPATIGRGRDATLTVKHPLVSRVHCKITELNGELVVQDLGSLNGTFISNEQLQPNEQYILPPDELLTVGGVTFRAVYDMPSGGKSAESTHTGEVGDWQPDAAAVHDTPAGDGVIFPNQADAKDAMEQSTQGPPMPPGFPNSGGETNAMQDADAASVDDRQLPPPGLPPAADPQTLPIEPNEDG